MILERGLLEMEYMEVTPSQVENYECALPPMRIPIIKGKCCIVSENIGEPL